MSVRREVADGLASRMSAAILTSKGSAADAGHKVASVQDVTTNTHYFRGAAVGSPVGTIGQPTIMDRPDHREALTRVPRMSMSIG